MLADALRGELNAGPMAFLLNPQRWTERRTAAFGCEANFKR
jgi:hypothetical protein